MFSKEGVTSGDDDRLGVLFRTRTTDELADEHHRAITHAGVADLLVDPVVRHLDVFSEQILFWDSDTSEVHVAVLFSMETNLRTNVTALNAREPVVVFVLDLYQEGMDSVVLSLDDGLGKDYGVVGNKREFSRPVLP